jgi:hypothetical protein
MQNDESVRPTVDGSLRDKRVVLVLLQLQLGGAKKASHSPCKALARHRESRR